MILGNGHPSPLSAPIPKDGWSFSTSWNVKQHESGADMVRHIKSLGFCDIELNYQVTRTMADDIYPLVYRNEIRISSVHHVFPKAEDMTQYGPDAYMLNHPDMEMRLHGEQLLVESAVQAERFGAEAVVLHPGEAIIEHRYDAELKRMYKEGLRHSAAYESLLTELKERRSEDGAIRCRMIAESLERVSEEITRRGLNVWIGLETRARIHQLPTLSEAVSIINSIKGAPVHLWIDTGHAIMMERLGLYSITEELPSALPYVKGMHIHDTAGLVDHWCPYVHSDDTAGFERFLPAIEQADLRVYEYKPVCEPEAIEESHRLLSSRVSHLKGAIRE
ncbi:sugar phosphate isomerase/epimerase family protein [Paenibacillus tarimensis]|uniref:sugar phosphate isomerase/epimerase family protein n=1 Tax=Paenibacillus tarimensis TaxID=416012 RepID=UPI001F2A224F|nr:TIM barrel protein [Paenibacillus tarimensis]MCF2944697.1 sugar phosphate isomerase/epimerase [Paenibacillus tarimensis]